MLWPMSWMTTVNQARSQRWPAQFRQNGQKITRVRNLLMTGSQKLLTAIAILKLAQFIEVNCFSFELNSNHSRIFWDVFDYGQLQLSIDYCRLLCSRELLESTNPHGWRVHVGMDLVSKWILSSGLASHWTGTELESRLLARISTLKWIHNVYVSYLIGIFFYSNSKQRGRCPFGSPSIYAQLFMCSLLLCSCTSYWPITKHSSSIDMCVSWKVSSSFQMVRLK